MESINRFYSTVSKSYSFADCYRWQCDDWRGHEHSRWRLCLQQCEHNTLFDFLL